MSTRDMIMLVCTQRGSKTPMALLQLLTLMNTPDKELIECAVMESKRTIKAADWNSYPTEPMFMACEYDSDKTAALYLNQVFFPSSRYINNRALFQVKDSRGDIPIHAAIRHGSSRVLEELVKWEDRDAKGFFSKETHAGNSDEIALEDSQTGLSLYLPRPCGCLPMHTAATRRNPSNREMIPNRWRYLRNSDLIFDLLIRYDAKHASLFPVSLFHQSIAPSSTRIETSMLLTQNHIGALPIHHASCGNVIGVRAMLQREFEAYRDFLPTQLSDGSQNDPQRRSQLLYARTAKFELPIDFATSICDWKISPEKNWSIVPAMLEFEVK